MSFIARAIIRSKRPSSGVAGVLSLATGTGATLDLTASASPAFADYHIDGIDRSGAAAASYIRKNVTQLITNRVLIGSLAWASAYGAQGQTLSGTDGIDQAASTGAWSQGVAAGYACVNDGAQAGISWTAPAVNSFTRKIRIYIENFSDWHVVASLSDGSATAIDQAIAGSVSGQYLEISFKSSNPTATLTFGIQKAAAATVMSVNRDFGLQAVTLQVA